MQRKLFLALIALGVVCLLQTTPTEAGGQHVQQLMKLFRGMEFDWSKKPFYLHRAKYGVQTQLRNPLCMKAMSFPRTAKLSQECLNQMVTQVKDLEGSFYAGFSYNCHEHDQYSMDCLNAAEPKYLSGLKQLASETEKCLLER
uniref:Aegyptin/gSG7 salivary protein-like four-helix bundle domain-containing protein n=1 Tax=Anopheles culicifacies TaxID=139723 RepID=A0A182LZH2_9DIPT